MRIWCIIQVCISASGKTLFIASGNPFKPSTHALGIWIGESEGAKFWLGVCNELKARGVQDVYANIKVTPLGVKR